MFTVYLRRLLPPLACLLLIASQNSLALKPEHEGKRLLLAAEQALQNGNFALAEQHLTQASALKIPLPAEYNYYQARVMFHQGTYGEARRQFEKYVDTAGQKGEFYEDALRQITLIDQRDYQSDTPKNTTPRSGSKPKAEIKWSDSTASGKAYVEHLQVLYMTENPAQALVIHINNLLDFYAYGDPRIKASNKLKDATRHAIRTTQRGEIVSVSQTQPPNEEEPVKEDRFTVFGLDPYIDFRCENRSASCWLIHPQSSHNWLQIVQNREAATELSKAMTQLIKEMQRGG